MSAAPPPSPGSSPGDGSPPDAEPAEGSPPGEGSSRSTGTVVGIVVAVLVVVVLVGGILVAANSGEDDTAGGSTSSSTTAGREPLTIERQYTPPTTRSEQPVTTLEALPTTGRPPVTGQIFLGDPLVDGGVVTSRLDGYNRMSHELEVPAGATATVTVTPLADDIDIVLTFGSNEEKVNVRQSGTPEVVTIPGPMSEAVEVDSFFGNAGPYEIALVLS